MYNKEFNIFFIIYLKKDPCPKKSVIILSSSYGLVFIFDRTFSSRRNCSNRLFEIKFLIYLEFFLWFLAWFIIWNGFIKFLFEKSSSLIIKIISWIDLIFCWKERVPSASSWSIISSWSNFGLYIPKCINNLRIKDLDVIVTFRTNISIFDCINVKSRRKLTYLKMIFLIS
jgi:hypothetical protein